MGTSVVKSLRALLAFFFFVSFSLLRLCSAISIRDGETIISAGGNFKLGFFSLSNSSNRYVGIWYNKITELTTVWVANRENPLLDSSGSFSTSNNGNFVILGTQNNVVWSTNISNVATNSTAELSDSGNLILTESNSGRVIWESFDHPTDTFLSTMKLGVNTFLTSWKDASDPSLGNFSFGISSTQKLPQAFIWNGPFPYWRSGPWNSRTFVGIPGMDTVYLNGFDLIKDSKVYIYFRDSFDSRFVLGWKGGLQQIRWDEERKDYGVVWSTPENQCDVYGKCGPFGSCNPLNNPICRCLRGYEPKSIRDWNMGNWEGGCVKRNLWECERHRSTFEMAKKDGFLKLGGVKLPDLADLVFDGMVRASACEAECMKNCSCVAYAVVSGIGCMVWSGDLMDLQEFSNGGEELYIRLANSELDEKVRAQIIVIVAVVLGISAMSVCTCFRWLWMANRGKKKREREMASAAKMLGDNLKQGKGQELPFFDILILVIATKNFNDANKLGVGGFGPVYKGKLPNGQEIAVKRLSKNSGQGFEEFKNEVVLISKLQHRNLVRLLGCCIEGEEKMLIYEYMPNKSLDAFIFDPTKQAILDWRKRFHIIEGISRGILYLHRDSRLRIIHRDLKASNILLDEELNPKISDFGMARIFGGNEVHANTRRVVGTYGYMSPEYAMEGRFSEKSDVFSFGVLLLEIVSGKQNTSFYHHEQYVSLLDCVWKLWNEDKLLELIDPTLYESCLETEVVRCIHVGLLCVQESANDRPTVSSIVSMLSSEIATLPTPKQPAFTDRPIPSFSMNNVTITTVDGR